MSDKQTSGHPATPQPSASSAKTLQERFTAKVAASQQRRGGIR